MAKKLTIIVGAVFLLIGLLAFVPNPIVGGGALFETDRAHDAVHLLSGLILLVVGIGAPSKAAATLQTFGFIYLAVTVLGFLTAGVDGEVLGVMRMNLADHILHLVLGVGLIALGAFALRKDRGL